VIEQLFGSKTRVKLLQLFFANPNRSFYVREITRKIDEQINSVRRELANLLSIGIIGSDANNNRLYYEVNQKYEYYTPLGMIFGGLPQTAAVKAKADSKSLPKEKAAPAPAQPVADVPPEHPLAKGLRTCGHVDLALLTGQFTRDETADIDLLIVGDVNSSKMAKFVEELEQTENKEIRYAIMTPADYKYRLQINDRFISKVLEAKKQIIISSPELDI